MLFPNILSFSILANSACATTIFSEAFKAQGLLGSHFGVPGIPASFDYVIIGGGTAGLTVARRLVVNASITVAVIEAGDFYQFANGNLSEIPAYASSFTGNNPTAKNPYLDCYKFHPADNSKRPQNSSAKYNVSDWSTSGGPAHVGYSSWVNPISSWLNVGFKEMGIKELTSLLSGNLMGWAYIALELNPTTQTRSSSEEFLSDALEKTTNLMLYKNTLAKKITFKNGVGTGVVVESGGLSYNLTANREVILSAGVLRSPQLLMVSGIGPKDAIQAQGIEVIADRPGVGQNMYDNVLVGPTYEVDVVTHNSLANPNFTAQAVAQYQKDRTGMLTNVGGDIAGFERLSPPDISNATYQALTSTYPSDWPHIEYLILDAYFGAGTDSTVGLGNGKQYVAASVGIVSTFSRGNITISSPDTAKNPVISPNWLLDPRDQDIAIAAFKRGRKLFSTTAMKPIVVQEAFPGANITSDAQILEIVKATANSVYNGAGTNKMGKFDDPLAVVDSKFKVIGVKGLRVVDASVFPFLPPGQPSATVYALAEKIADCILGGS
ncbi:putative choline dehydrogenase [Tricladium varicosporioides]|nr:putative choline dehydrogenase [Hymenoscyphus varicosporioides]